MTWDRVRFANNVLKFCDERRIPVNELESRLGLAGGFFENLREGVSDAEPGVDQLLAVSEQLSVSVDALLTFDFGPANDSEADLRLYMDKLIDDTLSHRLLWHEDAFGYLDTQVHKNTAVAGHPLFGDASGEDDSIQPFYISQFHPNLRTLIPVNTYFVPFSDNRTLYLVQVWNTGDDPDSPGDWSELELFMVRKQTLMPAHFIPLCHTDHEISARLDGAIRRLFAVVEETVRLPRLTDEGRAVVREYLGDTALPMAPSAGERSAHDNTPE